MSDQEFEREFRIYINNKESEAFSLKFYKDTPKEDMNLIVKETILNLMHYYKNSDLKVWQDSQLIDIDFEKNLLRFRDSLLLSEATPFTELNTRAGTLMNSPEEKEIRTDRFLSPESNRQSSQVRSPDKHETLDFGKEDSKGFINLNSYQTWTVHGHYRQSVDSRNIPGNNRLDTENINSNRNSNDPLKSLRTSNRLSELSITFNPNRNHSLWVDSQTMVTPLLKSGVTNARSSNPENFSFGQDENKTEENMSINFHSIPEHKSRFSKEKGNSTTKYENQS